jgi:N6-adenosine-specific RNA methylase IME4
MGPYSVIAADPPWAYVVRSPKGEGRSAKQHYNVMTLADIQALPVASWAAKDCTLFMWAIDPMVPQALETMDAWGFQFKTVGLYWVKTNLKSEGYFTGMGYWTRANPEMCLLGIRGHPKRKAKDVRRLIVAPRREHSRKPDEAYDAIERLVSGPYLEMFARQQRKGWDVWGNQTDKFNEEKVAA